MSLFILILKYLCSVHSFRCCPSPLILGHYSSVIIVHCFPLCLAKMIFFLPHLFSSILPAGFSLFSVALLWVVCKMLTQHAAGLAVVTSAHLNSYRDPLVFLGRLSKHSLCFSQASDLSYEQLQEESKASFLTVVLVMVLHVTAGGACRKHVPTQALELLLSSGCAC